MADFETIEDGSLATVTGAGGGGIIKSLLGNVMSGAGQALSQGGGIMDMLKGGVQSAIGGGAQMLQQLIGGGGGAQQQQ